MRALLSFQQIISCAMDQLQKCSQCLEIFNEKRLPLGLSSCPHYICQDCLNEALGGSFQVVVCGFCTVSVRKEEIVTLPAPPQVVINSSRRYSCIEKITQSKCDLEAEGVLLDWDGETTDAPSSTDGLCKLHHVHMDIICISDKERICPHCALFGNHKDHRFKRIQDFEKETQEKIKAFDEIVNAKQTYYQLIKENPQNTLQNCLEKGKIAIKSQIQNNVQCFIDCLRKKQQKLLQELDYAYQEVEEYLKRQTLFKKKQSVRAKLQKWEEECQSTKQMVLDSNTTQKKISCFYNSPLQIANQGSIYLEDLKYATETTNQTIMSKIKEIRVSVDTHMESIIEKCLKIERINVNNFIMGMELGDQADDRNPFMDCSEIGINSIDTLANNSIEVDISNLSHSKVTPQLTKTVKKPISSKQEIKSLKSIQKKQPPKPHQIRKKLTQSPSKMTIKQSRVSQMGSIRSPSKILSGTSLKEILPGTQIKSSEIKQPQKIYTEFSRNTLTDFFDISDCNLPSERVVEFVQRARRIQKIRGLKLSSNHLNIQGFEKLIDSLKGVGNINLANNEVNQGIFDLLIKNKDRMDALKIINLSHNPINFEKKTNGKIEELKRMGVIVIL